MIIFDYVFFRVAKFFYRKDGVDAFRAVCIISVIQGLIFGALLFSVLRLVYKMNEISKYKEISGKFGIALCVILLLFNYFRYKSKYWSFVERWKNETFQQSKVRGFLVLGIIFFSIFLVFWMGTTSYRE